MKTALAIAGALLIAPVSASATTVVLDFETVFPSYAFVSGGFYASYSINDYYAGGTSDNIHPDYSQPNQSPYDYGITFSDHATVVCMNTLDTKCSNVSRGGNSADSWQAALAFWDSSSFYFDVESGFIDNLSFVYGGYSANVQIYDGFGGTGSLLASFSTDNYVVRCPDTYRAVVCDFKAASMDFDGIGRSVKITGSPNNVVFDDVRLTLAATGAVPEAATWAMMIMGFGLVGAAMRRQRKALAA